MDINTNVTTPNTTTSNFTLVKCPVQIPLMSWDSSSFNDAAKVSSILAIAVNAITMPLTLFFNALIMFIVWKNASLQTERFIAIAFLALTDFLTALTCQPLFIAREIFHLKKDAFACNFDIPLFLFGFLLVGTSFYQIGIVTYERYVAIIQPFVYPTRITAKRLIYSSIAIWVIVVPSGILYILSIILKLPLYIDILDVLLRIVVIILIVYWYAKIAAATRRQNREIGQQHQSANNASMEQNRNGAITVGLLLACFLVPYIPLLILLLFKQVFSITSKAITSTELSLQSWVLTFASLNSCINPIIYGLRMTELREKCFKVLGLDDWRGPVSEET